MYKLYQSHAKSYTDTLISKFRVYNYLEHTKIHTHINMYFICISKCVKYGWNNLF